MKTDRKRFLTLVALMSAAIVAAVLAFVTLSFKGLKYVYDRYPRFFILAVTPIILRLFFLIYLPGAWDSFELSGVKVIESVADSIITIFNHPLLGPLALIGLITLVVYLLVRK